MFFHRKFPLTKIVLNSERAEQLQQSAACIAVLSTVSQIHCSLHTEMRQERMNCNLSIHYNKFHGSKKELREKFFENLPEMLCETKYFSV